MQGNISKYLLCYKINGFHYYPYHSSSKFGQTQSFAIAEDHAQIEIVLIIYFSLFKDYPLLMGRLSKICRPLHVQAILYFLTRWRSRCSYLNSSDINREMSLKKSALTLNTSCRLNESACSN